MFLLLALSVCRQVFYRARSLYDMGELIYRHFRKIDRGNVDLVFVRFQMRGMRDALALLRVAKGSQFVCVCVYFLYDLKWAKIFHFCCSVWANV